MKSAPRRVGPSASPGYKGVMTDAATELVPVPTPQPAQRITVRALLLGDRIDTTGLERSDMISSAPFAFRIAENGFVALFRYGVIVLGGSRPSRRTTCSASSRRASPARCRASTTRSR